MDYDTVFGTDWDSLTTQEAIRRAYALGVAEGMGSPREEEYERVLAELDTSYDRNIADLSYEEGRTEALDLRADVEESDAVWNELVVEDEAGDEPIEIDVPEDLPSNVSRPELLDPPDDEVDAVRLPDFLTR